MHRTFLLGVLLALPVVSEAASSDCVDYADSIRRVGGVSLPGEAVAVAASGDLVFVAAESSGVHIVDATDPSAAILLATWDAPSKAVGVAVAGGLLAVADRDFGLRLADVRDPANPLPLGTLATPTLAPSIALRDSIVFLVEAGFGVRIIDATQPESPEVVDSLATPYPAVAVAIMDDLRTESESDHVVAVVDYYGLSVFQGSPGSYELSRRSEAPDMPVAVAAGSGSIFVADATLGLLAYASYGDLGLPPITVQGTPAAIAVDRNLVWLVTGAGMVHVFDAILPDQPVLEMSLPLLPGTGIAAQGRHVLVAAGNAGLEIVNNPNPLLSTFPGSTQGATAWGSYLLRARGNVDLDILEVLPLSSLKTSSELPLPGFAYDVAAQGTVACVAYVVAPGPSGIHVVDLSDPLQPNFLESVTLGPCSEVEMAGDLAYATGADWGLQVLDLSNPSSVEPVASLGTLASALDLHLEGSRLYIVNYDSLQIVDVSDPGSPSIAGELPLPGTPSSVAIAGDFAYVATGDLELVDISDPAAPLHLGTIPTPNAVAEVAVRWPYLYAAGGDALSVLDVRLPDTPVLVGTQPAHVDVRSLIAENDYVAISGFDGTFFFAPQCDPLTPTFLSAFEVHPVGEGIRIRWETAIREGVSAFRLSARSGGETWEVEVAAEGPTRFVAHDLYAGSLGAAEVTFTLEHRAAHGAWVRIAKETISLPGSGLALPRLWAIPNPTRSRATIVFHNRRHQHVRLSILDLAGREVARLADTEFPAGRHELAWNGSQEHGAAVAPGVYVLHLVTREGTLAGKLVVLNDAGR